MNHDTATDFDALRWTPVEEIGLTIRTTERLEALGILTFGDVLKMPEDELVRQIGPGRMQSMLLDLVAEYRRLLS